MQQLINAKTLTGGEWRYPDKPIHSTVDFLKIVPESSEWICQQKIDGWRICCYVDNYVDIYTRHKNSLNSALKNEIPKNIISSLAALNLGTKTIYDGEFLGRRELKEMSIVLFDILKIDNKWITNWPYYERLGKLKELIDSRCDKKYITTPEYCLSGFADFYENQKKLSQKVEGVVLKKMNSKLICSRNDSALNPEWFKIRFRN